jgi:hypothetical protein
MEKYLIVQNQISEIPADFIAADGSHMKETVVCEVASDGKETSPSRVLYGWLWLNQIDYSLHRTSSGGFVAADGSEVWQPGDCSADLPHLESTLVVEAIYE